MNFGRSAAATLLVLAAPLSRTPLFGQASPTATGPGSYVALGISVDGFHLPYGEQRAGGISAYLDANLTQRYGLEAEAGTIRFGTEVGTRAASYLLGPRISVLRGRVQPYAKVLLGRGTFTFPFNYARSSYLVLAPGAGISVRCLHNRVYVRALDFEYQDWHDFTFGASHPYGVSAGISIRVF